MQILFAPDSMKGSLTAAQQCSLAARLWAPEILRCVPLADGGEGSLEALRLGGLMAQERTLPVQGPNGQWITASYLWQPHSRTAYVELAQASGLHLIDLRQTNCLQTNTLGTGQLIADALARGAERIILFLGGSATNDAALGLCTALGYVFVDAQGHPLPPMGAALAQVHNIHPPQQPLPQAEWLLATDVENPFAGTQGAAYIYAPQKGANQEQVRLLDQGLQHLASVLARQTGIDPLHLVGAGAAGGVAGTLMALLGAKRVSGADWLMEAVQLPQAVQGARALIVSEGRFDNQSLQGKLVGRLLGVASRAGIPVGLLCGYTPFGAKELTQYGIAAHRCLAQGPDDVPEAIRRADFRFGPMMQDLVAELRHGPDFDLG